MSNLNYQQVKKILPIERNLVINLFLILMIIFPYLMIFSQIDRVIEEIDVSLIYTILSFFAFSSILVIFVLRAKSFSVKLLIFGLISILLALINLQFSLMAVPKIFLNWIAFTFIAVVIGRTMMSLSEAEMLVFQKKSMTVFKYVVLTLTIMMLVVWSIERWYLDMRLVQYYVFDDQNQIIRILTSTIGLEKQAYGNFLILLFSFVTLHWKYLSWKSKALYIFFLMLNLPFIAGIRTVILALIMGGSWFFFLKNTQRKFFAGVIALQVIFLIFYFQQEIFMIITLLYDRLPSVQFAWSAMTDNLFGLGIGAYHIYVREHNDRLVDLFGSEGMELSEVFWDAPESDIVYFVASWGILSVIFLVLFIKIALSSKNIFHHNSNAYPIEKTILMNMTFMIFMGISQDNAGQLYWWLILSFAIGIMLRHEMRQKEPNQIRKE